MGYPSRTEGGFVECDNGSVIDPDLERLAEAAGRFRRLIWERFRKGGCEAKPPEEAETPADPVENP